MAGIEQSKVWIEKVTLRSTADVNDNSPVKVHVVIAYTDDLAKSLKKMKAIDYFKQAGRLKADAGDDLDVFSIDLIPDMTETLEIKPSYENGKIALIFARYLNPGDHRQNIGEYYDIFVELDKSDFKITPTVKA